MPSRFAWYELMTTDVPAAHDFYTRLVGWGLQNFEVPGQPSPEPYVMWTRGGQPIGGSMRLPEDARKAGAPPHWLAYVSVPSVDASFKQALGLGAREYVAPTDIPGGGRFAILGDPQGASFGIVQEQQGAAQKDAPAPQAGDFTWHELATSDLDAALRFYQALFGWEKGATNDMGAMGVYQEYGIGGHSLGGMYKILPQMPQPPHWLLYVLVPNVDSAAEAAKARGATVLHGPTDVPGGDRIVAFTDPQGAAFALHQKKG